MSSDNEPSTSGRNHHATVYYDYNTPKVEKNNYSKKPLVFNGMLLSFPCGRVTCTTISLVFMMSCGILLKMVLRLKLMKKESHMTKRV